MEKRREDRKQGLGRGTGEAECCWGHGLGALASGAGADTGWEDGSTEGLQHGERSAGRAEAPGAASPEIFRMGFAMAWIFLTAPAFAEGRKRSGLA